MAKLLPLVYFAKRPCCNLGTRQPHMHANIVYIGKYLHRLSIFPINCTENGECVMTA